MSIIESPLTGTESLRIELLADESTKPNPYEHEYAFAVLWETHETLCTLIAGDPQENQ